MYQTALLRKQATQKLMLLQELIETLILKKLFQSKQHLRSLLLYPCFAFLMQYLPFNYVRLQTARIALLYGKRSLQK